MCKASINARNIMVVDEESSSSTQLQRDEADNSMPYNLSRRNDKMRNLELILENRPHGSKFLIFSANDTSLTQITGITRRVNVEMSYLKGNSAQVNCIVERYKSGSIDALLINPRFYGSGLNLEMTTDVVMFHKFDTEIEAQVIGRAQRFGRRAPLNVWYLLHDNEAST
jgi:SNF2 family DNA or RNA helicase